MGVGSTQTLVQGVGHRYGWSVVFDTNGDGFWYVDVVVGINDKRRFVSQDNSPPTKLGIKQGKDSAAKVALDGLRTDIAQQEAKQAMELSQAFATTQIVILESNEETWNRFWNDHPKVVGVDTEGNQVSPPVLVQVATEDYAILEVSLNEKLSNDLLRLLSDDSIVKVFCDNYSNHDKKSLGLPIPQDLRFGPVVDLECIASTFLGSTSVPRGLSRIVALVMPELNVRIEKPTRAKGKAKFANIGKYTLIEQGRAPPLRSTAELSEKEKRYAALDAWCTLRAFQRLQKQSAVA